MSGRLVPDVSQGYRHSEAVLGNGTGGPPYPRTARTSDCPRVRFGPGEPAVVVGARSPGAGQPTASSGARFPQRLTPPRGQARLLNWVTGS